MDLIDRSKIDFYKLTGPELVSAMEEAPSVPVVPLDKLCEWLSESGMNIPCESCQHFANQYCTAIGDMSKPCPKTKDDWREAITKWMEEQDAAD